MKLLAVSWMALALACAGQAQGTYNIFGIRNATMTVATGVNSRGTVAGWLELGGTQELQGFTQDTNGTTQTFLAPGSASGPFVGTVVTAINSWGMLTGTYVPQGSTTTSGMVRFPNGKFQEFGAPGDGSYDMTPTCINDAGTVAGWYYDSANILHGFVLTLPGGMETFEAPQACLTSGLACGTVVTAINNAGVTAGYYWSNSEQHGFVRGPAGQAQTLDVAGSLATVITGINANGVTTGYFNGVTNIYHGFVRSSSGVVTKFDPPGSCGCLSGTIPMAINSAGVVTGRADNGGFVRAADGTIQTINPPGTLYSSPFAINDAGVIAGPYGNLSFIFTP